MNTPISLPVKAPPNPADDKLQHIDTLRGFAVLQVMLVHTAQSVLGLSPAIWSVLNYGKTSIQLFFLVSAFTISLSLDRRGDENARTLKFFVRRFFRIAPLYYVALLWYFLFRSALYSFSVGHLQTAHGYTLTNILANVFFVNGFYPPANNNIVPGGWSIGTEMAFYVCFPLLFLLYQKLSEKGTLRFVLLSAATLIIYYLFENLMLRTVGSRIHDKLFLYYNVLNQMPVFILGMLTYFLMKKETFAKVPMPLQVLAFFALTWATSQSPNFIVVTIMAGLSFVFLHNVVAYYKALNPTFLRRIGQVSFSLFIWHFTFAWNGAEFLNHYLQGVLSPPVLLAIYYPLTVGFAFFFANLSEKYIEQWGIRKGREISRKLGSASPTPR